jgi:hypothetical protein
VFRQATERAVDSAADLRWGPDRKGFRRLVHPNGICLTGLWQITEDTGYSGYFRNGSRALIVGRYSTCCRERDGPTVKSPAHPGFGRILIERIAGDMFGGTAKLGAFQIMRRLHETRK